MASRYDFVQSGKDKNKLITNRAEWAGITVDKVQRAPCSLVPPLRLEGPA
jgi:hypothetical protein